MNVLPLDQWTERARAHRELVSPMADAFLKRRELGKTHAVHDFLFTYYGCSPQKLKQWIPSFEESIEISSATKENFPWLKDYWFTQEGQNLSLNRDRLQPNAKGLAGFVAELCESILNKSPRFGCFGLHEWAMVYKMSPEDIRHKGQSLRMPPDQLAVFVESQSLRCTHYDAFRFFTPEARPLNALSPTLDSRLQLEQGGCVHVNMDLYKWTLKLWPWLGSDFMAKTFLLALHGRELDMRASPYDLEKFGFPPICIETDEGRKHYQREQLLLHEKSTILREELREKCLRLAAV